MRCAAADEAAAVAPAGPATAVAVVKAAAAENETRANTIACDLLWHSNIIGFALAAIGP